MPPHVRREGERKRRPERAEHEDDGAGSDDSQMPDAQDNQPVTRGVLRDMFRDLVEECRTVVRSEVTGGMQEVRSEVAAVRADVSQLNSRVAALESRTENTVVPAVATSPGGRGADPWHAAAATASSARAAGSSGGAPAPAPVAPRLGVEAGVPPMPAPVSVAAAAPVRIEFTNCHEYSRRMQEAFDEQEAHLFLRKIMAALSAELRQLLLPDAEQIRRNSRALVFVPVLHTQPNLDCAARDKLMNAMRGILATGNFDRHGRRPRVRWELRPDQRPLSKLLGMTHRLTEMLALSHPSLAKWKVQPAGKGVEFWLLRNNMRPFLVGKVNEGMSLSSVVGVDGVLTAQQVETAWSNISSS